LWRSLMQCSLLVMNLVAHPVGKGAGGIGSDF
jgi:hypothetical protein